MALYTDKLGKTSDMNNFYLNNLFVKLQYSYFLMEFNAPPSSLEDLSEEYGRDVDIIRQRIYKVKEEPQQECTLHEELQPAPYRKDVQDLIAEARKLDKPKFKYNSGLDYYPFQK